MFDGSFFFLNMISDYNISPTADWSRRFALIIFEYPTIFAAKYLAVKNISILSLIYGISLKTPFILSLYLSFIILEKEKRNLLLLPIVSYFLRASAENYFVVSESNFAAELFWPLLFLSVKIASSEIQYKRDQVYLLAGIAVSCFTYQSFFIFNLAFFYIFRKKIKKQKMIIIALLASSLIQIYSSVTFYCEHCRNGFIQGAFKLSSYGVFGLILILLVLLVIYISKKKGNHRVLIGIFFIVAILSLFLYFSEVILPSFWLHRVQRIYHTLIPLLLGGLFLINVNYSKIKLYKYQSLSILIIFMGSVYSGFCSYMWTEAKSTYVERTKHLSGVLSKDMIKDFIRPEAQLLVMDYSAVSKHIMLYAISGQKINLLPTVKPWHSWSYPSLAQLNKLYKLYDVSFGTELIKSYQSEVLIKLKLKGD